MDSLSNVFVTEASRFDGPVLVTGAGGCIGSWALAILTRAGVPVVVLDASESKRRPRLLIDDPTLDAVPWVVADIADTEAVERTVAEHRVRAIVHLAALQVPFCKADPVAGARANVVGTVNVLESARRHGIRRVAYASSIAAHGADENAPWLATLYGAYKRCDEMIARVYWQDWQVPSVGMRPGVVYGIGRDQGMTSKTTVAILAAAAGRDYSVPFRGPTSWLYAGEVASAFVQAVATEREGAAVFDCNGVPASVEAGLEHLRRLEPAARVEATGSALPFPFDLSDDPLRAYIGDYGRISMQDGIAETLGAFRALLDAGKVDADSIA